MIERQIAGWRGFRAVLARIAITHQDVLTGEGAGLVRNPPVLEQANHGRKRDDAARFLSEMPAEFTVVYDAPGAVPAAYAVKGMPSSYVIDQSGNVSAVEQGFRDESRTMLEQKIRALLAPR